MKPRKWTADEKLAIVIKGLKEKKPVAEICREHQISESFIIVGEISFWRLVRGYW